MKKLKWLVSWLTFQVLVSKSWHNGRNVPSIKSPVMDKERLWPGHWLGSVLCVSFSALSLLVG